MKLSLTLLTLLLSTGVPSGDHPLVSPYQGSKLRHKKVTEFDEYLLPLGPTKAEAGKRSFERSQPLEGRVTSIDYSNPRERSTLEVFRNYTAALEKGGFERLFSCVDDACGRAAVPHKTLGSFDNRSDSYAAFRLRRPEGDVYVAVRVIGYETSVDIVEVKPMDTGMVKVSAETLAGDIGREGHAAIYGILFATDKADVEPESEPTLREIERLLASTPSLRLHVVGHTDSSGAFAHNVELSRRRAAAVVKWLSSRPGIAAERLRGDGVGPLAPVASNRTEAGRARNRRVELVEQ